MEKIENNLLIFNNESRIILNKMDLLKIIGNNNNIIIKARITDILIKGNDNIIENLLLQTKYNKIYCSGNNNKIKVLKSFQGKVFIKGEKNVLISNTIKQGEDFPKFLDDEIEDFFNNENNINNETDINLSNNKTESIQKVLVFNSNDLIAKQYFIDEDINKLNDKEIVKRKLRENYFNCLDEFIYKKLIKNNEIEKFCHICLKEFYKKDIVKIFTCESKHIFHKICLKFYMKKSILCPICNEEVKH